MGGWKDGRGAYLKGLVRLAHRARRKVVCAPYALLLQSCYVVDVDTSHDLAQHGEIVVRELVRLGVQAEIQVVQGRFDKEVVEGRHL